MMKSSVMDFRTHEGIWENRRTNRRFLNDVTSRARENIEIKVIDPMTVVIKEKAVYTVYRIEIKDTALSTMGLSWSSVRRRYSEFVWLDRKLKKRSEQNSRSLPVLPEKKLLGRFAVDFILRRQHGLQQYLQCLFQHDMFRNNPYLHLFLQTEFTLNEIETILQRQDPTDVRHIIMLARANQHQEPSHRKTTPAVSDYSSSGLDINDVIGSSESWSTGYHGDEEGLDLLSESSISSHTYFDLQGMVGNNHSSSSSQESIGASFEEFFEFEELSKRGFVGPSVDLPFKESLVEYVMPVSSYDGDSYIVYAKRVRTQRETYDQRIKRLVNEYQVISIL